MANVNAPHGFVPVCDTNNRRYTGGGSRYYKSATANMRIAKGDRVTRITSTDPNGYPEITKAAANAPCTGVVVGFEVVPSDLHKLCLEATDVGYVIVEDDPNILYQVQANGALTLAAIGRYINPIANLDGDNQTGLSKLQLDATTIGTGTSCRIERLEPTPGNEVGIYGKWLVRLNQSTEINASASNLTVTS